MVRRGSHNSVLTSGFSMIFSVSDLQIFSPDELGLLCGNADEDWSRESESGVGERLSFSLTFSPRAGDQG